MEWSHMEQKVDTIISMEKSGTARTMATATVVARVVDVATEMLLMRGGPVMWNAGGEVATVDLLWRPKYETCRGNETAIKP